MNSHLAYRPEELLDFSKKLDHDRIITHPLMDNTYDGKAWTNAQNRRLVYELNRELYDAMARWVPGFDRYLLHRSTNNDREHDKMVQGRPCQFHSLSLHDEATDSRYRVITQREYAIYTDIHSDPLMVQQYGVIRRVFLALGCLYYVIESHPHRRRGILPNVSGDLDQETVFERVARRRKLHALISP